MFEGIGNPIIPCKKYLLPPGYREVESFTMNNDCYFEIPNMVLYGSDTIMFSLSRGNACNVLGNYNSADASNNYSLYVTNNGRYLRYNGGSYNSVLDLNVKYDVTITPTGCTGMKNNSTWTRKEFQTNGNLFIGITSLNATSAKFIGTLYGRITVLNRCICIPCERISDGTLGYYEAVQRVFVPPSIGTPTAGPYV